MTTLLLLGAALLLVLMCGLFVAAEFSLVAVDRSRVQQAADAGDERAEGVERVLSSLSTHLSGAQVGITVTNLGIGFLAEPAIADLLRGELDAVGIRGGAVDGVSLAVALVSSTLITMVLGELVPKNLALALPLGTARATQGFLRGFTTATRLPIRVLNGSANAIVRRLGVEPQEELRSARSSAELASLIQHSADVGVLDADTAELMERSVEFGSRTAGEIMTPRMRTQTLDQSDRAAAVIELARTSGHSRFPVLDETDAVVGAVHVKHAVAQPVHERPLQRIKNLMVRPVFVPETLRLDPLLALLREDGFQLAVVLDEYGGFAGIVTLEDVVEEIVGDIADEHDVRGARARRRRDGSWVLSGLLRPDEVEDATGVALPESEDYDTLGGLVMRVLGEVPAVGQVAEVAVPDPETPERERLAVLTVERMDGMRVDSVVLRVHGEGPVGPAPAGQERA